MEEAMEKWITGAIAFGQRHWVEVLVVMLVAVCYCIAEAMRWPWHELEEVPNPPSPCVGGVGHQDATIMYRRY